ncbi:relaxase/mobilization nuclease RlxS [Sphingopyxis sp. KK2]|uniref:relaxase/mobilization nuclease RlxS n=1 Tax=Sphingopyxis sp. KK2 TaxID=1855727 RepID=UPI00097E6575|nr:relaxase/mobilization nuclease RlxS [Sphingopyxis sp. KK2]
MSGDEEDFEPRLGRMRAARGKKARKYLGRLLAAGLAGRRLSPDPRRFDGSRIGRGSANGRLLSSRGGRDWNASRRVVVKTRLVRLGSKGVAAARAHLKYIQRDGVTREGEPGQLYNAREDLADGSAFLNRGAGDRHQFRFIVSVEEGDLYDDLRPFVRRLMTAMEDDLGTKLEWVAVDHFNTGHPHSHIMLRGKDDRGENLVIARDYIAHGIRARASEIATLDLGPKTRLEIETRLRRDMSAERLTEIDRQFLRAAERLPLVSAKDKDPVIQTLQAGRLQKLGAMGLADEIAPGQWRLEDGMQKTLERMGEQGDIIRTMQREMTARSRALAPAERVIHDTGLAAGESLVGKVAARGLADEYSDRHYLIIDGVDGRSHYVPIGRGEAVGPIPANAVVRLSPATAGVREADRTIAAVALANGGRYDVAAHQAQDPSASRDFIESHVRRLEAMRRLARVVDRANDGSWAIGSDHLARAERYERDQIKDRPVAVEILSAVPVERLARAEAVTWLDREANSDDRVPLRDHGFGSEVRAAIAIRQRWLIDAELADEIGEAVVYRKGALAQLQRRELLRLAQRLSTELGKRFEEVAIGERITGRLVRRIDGAGASYAVIEKAKQFTLVPWKPVFERSLGKDVAGQLREGGVSWTFGRSRGGPTIA